MPDTMKLTDELAHAVAARPAEAVRFTDPDTGAEYVLVRADLYDRLRAMADGVTRRAGWDDPALDAYEQYRKSP